MRRIKTIAIECLSICDLDRLFFFSRPGVVARFGGWRPFRCVCFPLPEVFGISGFWGVWRAVVEMAHPYSISQDGVIQITQVPPRIRSAVLESLC